MFLEFHGGRGATGAWLSDDDFYPAKICGLLKLPLPHVITAGEIPDGHRLPGGAVEDALYSFETFGGRGDCGAW